MQNHHTRKSLSVAVREVTDGVKRRIQLWDVTLRSMVNDRSHWGMPWLKGICIANVDGRHLLQTCLTLPASGAKTHHVHCCLLLGWMHAFCQSWGESRVKKASCWCVKMCPDYLKQGSNSTSCHQVLLVGPLPRAIKCQVPPYWFGLAQLQWRMATAW